MCKSILIVDDNAQVRQTLRHRLERDGSDWKVCAEAKDGREAVVQAQNMPVDLIVIDLSMPRMNGLEAARLLKQTNPNVPIVMLTLYKDDALEREAYAAGISAVLSKADDIRKLISCARVLLMCASPS